MCTCFLYRLQVSLSVLEPSPGPDEAEPQTSVQLRWESNSDGERYTALLTHAGARTGGCPKARAQSAPPALFTNTVFVRVNNQSHPAAFERSRHRLVALGRRCESAAVTLTQRGDNQPPKHTHAHQQCQSGAGKHNKRRTEKNRTQSGGGRGETRGEDGKQRCFKS